MTTPTTPTPEKFKSKYRIASARLPHFDYSTDGAYLPAGRQVSSQFAPKTANTISARYETESWDYRK